MGRTEIKKVRPFTPQDVQNRDLVIKMLKYEESFAKSEKGQSLYKNPLNRPFVSLNVEHSINRVTLDHFNFDTSDESVGNYRTIFKTYFKSPNDYDKEVINSSYYMRNNKCVFYQHPPLKLGEKIPNCELTLLDGKTKTTLYDAIAKENGKHTVFAAFSLS